MKVFSCSRNAGTCGLINVSAPVVTDKGSNMVAGFCDTPRIDCACHRLHTVFNDAYKETQSQCQSLKNMKKLRVFSANSWNRLQVFKKLCLYQSNMGIIHVRGHPSTAVHTALTKATWNSQRSWQREGDCRRRRRRRRRRRIFYIPSYYKLYAMGAIDEQDSIEIAALKDNFILLLQKKFYTSITQYHWIANFLDPGLKSFSFLPNSTSADKKFKRDLLKDIPEWSATDQQRSGTGIISPNIIYRIIRDRDRWTTKKRKPNLCLHPCETTVNRLLRMQHLA